MEDERDFERGDELATAGDKVALEYGWWADRWIRAEAERAGDPGDADPDSRAAFSYALGVLEKRHCKSLSRSQIADRIRVGRAFPREKYKDLSEELNYRFTFSQLRAAYIRDDETKTMELLLWTREKDADPMAINAKKMGDSIESDDAKAWRHMVEWACKYRERVCATKWNEANRERDRLAREIVECDRKQRLEPKREVQ